MSKSTSTIYIHIMFYKNVSDFSKNLLVFCDVRNPNILIRVNKVVCSPTLIY